MKDGWTRDSVETLEEARRKWSGQPERGFLGTIGTGLAWGIGVALGVGLIELVLVAIIMAVWIRPLLE